MLQGVIDPAHPVAVAGNQLVAMASLGDAPDEGGRDPMGYRTYTCPIARECGGCEWLAVPYPIQLRRKVAEVEEVFSELLEDPAHGARAPLTIHGMDQPVGYRHKAATPFAPAKRGRIRSGFYQRGTHRIVHAPSCLVEAPGCRQVLSDVALIAQDLGIRAYDEDRGRGCLRHAVIRQGWQTGEALLTIVTNGGTLPHAEELARRIMAAHPQVTSVVQNVNQRRTNAILGRENHVIAGSGTMTDRLLGATFTIGPTSFYQTNPAQTEVLYGRALDLANLAGARTLLDTYCGIGTMGICAAMASPSLEVTAVEKGHRAVADARHNAKVNAVDDRVTVIEADATEHMVEAARKGRSFDVVLMDPPRAGSTPAFLQALDAIAPRAAVYVSCNPRTQRRDVDVLVRRGWTLDALEVVDMFPHTKHAETVALLTPPSR